MTDITLDRNTLMAIRKYIDNYEPGYYGHPDSGHVEDAVFEQDGCSVYVDFDYYGRTERWSERHDEVPSPNTETFAEYVHNGAEITRVVAYDTDGEEITVTNFDDI